MFIYLHLVLIDFFLCAYKVVPFLNSFYSFYPLEKRIFLLELPINRVVSVNRTLFLTELYIIIFAGVNTFPFIASAFLTES